MTEPARTLVLHCPDWPLTAAGLSPEVPAIEVAGQSVTAATPAARAEGIGPGTRLRSAQQRCPDVVVVEPDPDRNAGAFEPVLAALGALTPALEAFRPGVCSFAARGAARYHGGERRLAELTLAAATRALADTGRIAAGIGIGVGIADGPFAAELAARAAGASDTGPRIVPAGQSLEFLARFGLDALSRPALADLLQRLGVDTLGAFAALPAPEVADRFGADGARAHRLARGLDARPLRIHHPETELSVQTELDPPAERVDTAAFAARALAEHFGDQLAARSLICTRVAIEAETEHGETLRRLWRHDGALDAAAIAERMRWQLDGWLNNTDRGTSATGHSGVERPTAGISLLRLVPDQVCLDEGVQDTLDSAHGADRRDIDSRAARALARIQGLLGPGSVRTAVPGGGRSPTDRITWVRWGDPPEPRLPAGHPWPGRLVTPSPATVYTEPRRADVRDAHDVSVGVTGRYLTTAAPALLSVEGARPVEICGWAGPWPVEERWWDPAAARRRARFQVQTVDGGAWLLVVESGQWWAEARYD